MNETLAEKVGNAVQQSIPGLFIFPSEIETVGKAAMKVILDEVVRPEYDRWYESDEIGAQGACANITARLLGVEAFAETKPAQPKSA